ncbi:hypothetical protein BR141012304_20023 [Brucella inopinata]|nr:hypothetical protein BR141012304_20023 [Brucella inopinata]
MSQDHHHLNHTTWECKYHVVFTPNTAKKHFLGMCDDRLEAYSTILPAARNVGSRKDV